jgi:hypothetical protein
MKCPASIMKSMKYDMKYPGSNMKWNIQGSIMKSQWYIQPLTWYRNDISSHYYEIWNEMSSQYYENDMSYDTAMIWHVNAQARMQAFLSIISAILLNIAP